MDVSADAAVSVNDALDGPESLDRVMFDAVDNFVETLHERIVPALQPAFAAQAEHARRALHDLRIIAERGRA